MDNTTKKILLEDLEFSIRNTESSLTRLKAVYAVLSGSSDKLTKANTTEVCNENESTSGSTIMNLECEVLGTIRDCDSLDEFIPLNDEILFAFSTCDDDMHRHPYAFISGHDVSIDEETFVKNVWHYGSQNANRLWLEANS